MASTRNTLKLSRLDTSSWMPRIAALSFCTRTSSSVRSHSMRYRMCCCALVSGPVVTLRSLKTWAPAAVAKSVPSFTATTRAFCAGTRPASSTLAAHLPADVMLVEVGRNLVRPVHEVIIRVGALEEGMLIPIWIDGRLQGVFVPLAVRCHHTRPLRLGGREDIGGEVVHQVKDAGTE